MQRSDCPVERTFDGLELSLWRISGVASTKQAASRIAALERIRPIAFEVPQEKFGPSILRMAETPKPALRSMEIRCREQAVLCSAEDSPFNAAHDAENVGLMESAEWKYTS